MLSVLAHRPYRHLFAAQVVALLGTGLATVALGLLAFELAGGAAGAVLGTVLTIKMVAYVAIAPVAAALVERLPRRAVLVTLDLVRAAVALVLPFVTEVWQVYGLILLLQSASAAFTPVFQATIPDLLPDEKDYTRALSLSRLAYDLENLLSPTLAALLLLVVSFHGLFAGTVVGFLASAALVVTVLLPDPEPTERRGLYQRTTGGMRIYLATPRLRGLLALNLAAAAAGAMVLVNTVVLVRGLMGRPESDVALALASFGGGSMLAALLLPRLLERVADRTVMLSGAGALLLAMLALAAVLASGGLGWPVLLGLWALLGLSYATVLTPSGRLLRRSSHRADRSLLFAAQFALSHACWLVAYPLAGWLGAEAGMTTAAVVLGGLVLVGVVGALSLWPQHDPETLSHLHADLAAGHPHLRDAEPAEGGFRHSHPFVIDADHRHWPP